MSKNDGGSAFPCTPPQDTAAGVATGYPYPEAGMTLRDYFAAKAMAALLNDPERADQSREECARLSYAIADAMLAERSK